MDGKFIRTTYDKDISCTISAVTSTGLATTEYSYFKQALFPISTLIFYRYKNELYYPLTMEFRLIDNNILFLTNELCINKASVLINILESSMHKEEKWSNIFKIVVIETTQLPKFCKRLMNFEIDIPVEIIYE